MQRSDTHQDRIYGLPGWLWVPVFAAFFGGLFLYVYITGAPHREQAEREQAATDATWTAVMPTLIAKSVAQALELDGAKNAVLESFSGNCRAYFGQEQDGVWWRSVKTERFGDGVVNVSWGAYEWIVTESRGKYSVRPSDRARAWTASGCPR